MTRLSLLEEQQAIFVAQREELGIKNHGIYVREQQAISEALLPFFYEFSEEVEVEVTGESVYFKMDHPELNCKKELFNLYLRENYDFEDGKRSYDGIDLSYYTTSTKGVDFWELKRLQLLGKLAEIVHEFQQKMVYVVNEAVKSFKEEYNAVYVQQQLISGAIKELEVKVLAFKREKIAFDLKGQGVEFEKGRQIKLKFNYSPTVVSIRLTDVSKSGKTCTAVFKWAHGGNASQEEKVNVSSIIDQVHRLRDNIVSTSELV